MAANYDEDVIIPLRFEVHDSGDVNEYVSRIKAELQVLKKSFEQAPKGDNEFLKNMQKEALAGIKSVEAGTSELSKMSGAIDRAKQDYLELQQMVMQMGKAMKSGSGKYANTTEAEFEDMKNQARDAKAIYQQILVNAKAYTDEIGKERSKLAQMSGQYESIGRTIKSTGEIMVSSQKGLKDREAAITDTIKREEAQLQSLREAYKEITEELKASGKDPLTSEEGKENLKAYHLRAKQIHDEYETKRLIIKAEQGDIDAVEQLVKLEEQRAKAMADEEREAERAARENRSAVNEQVRAYNQQIGKIKQSTAQYYYQLRAVKMLGFTLTSMNNKMSNFGKSALSSSATVLKNYLRLATGFTVFGKAIGVAFRGLKKFNSTLKNTEKGMKNVRKAQSGLNISLKELIKGLLKYGLGIRSVYVLFNRLRRAVVDGIKNMVRQYDAVNKQMSSVITSLNQMKNAVAGAVQPILNALAPALEKISALLSDLAYKVASFIATLTGQKSVYKAIRYQMDYAESLDKTGKKAKEAKKELSGLDKLNVLKSDDTSDDNSVAKMFEEVPIDKTMAEWAKKFKDFFKRLFKPIKAAWDKEGDFVMKSWKKALKEIKGLMSDIARDFWKVWEEPKTQEIFEDFFHILGDIGLVVANLAKNLRKAWNVNDNGYKIFKAIRDVIYEIIHAIREAADYTVKWSDKLDFVPLFTTLADVLTKQVVPAVHDIMQLLKWIYQYVFLEFLKHFIERTLPALIASAGNIVEAIGHIANGILKALNRANTGKKIVAAIEKIIDVIVDGIYDCSEYTRDWAKELKFYKLFESIKNALVQSIPAVQSIVNLFKDLYRNIILPLATYVIEVVLPNAFAILGNINETIGLIVDNIRKAFAENERGEKIISTIRTIVEKIGSTIAYCVEQTKEWSKNLDFSNVVKSLHTWLESMQKPISFISDTFSNFYNNVLLPFWKYIVEKGLPKLFDKLTEINKSIDWESLTTKVNEFLKAFEPFLEKVWDTLVIILGDIGEALSKFVNSENFDKIIDKLIEWMNNADAETMANSIERIAIAFVEIKAFLGLFSKMVLPIFTTIMTIINVFKQFSMITKVKELTTAVEALSGAGGTGGMAGLATETGEAAVASEGLSAIFGTIAKVAGIVGVVVGTLLLAYDDFNGILNKVKETIGNIIQYFKDVANAMHFEDKINNLKNAFGELKDSFDVIITAFKGGESDINAFKVAWDAIFALFEGLVKIIIGVVVPAFGGLMSVVSGVIKFIAGAIQAFHAAITVFVGAIVSLISGDDSTLIKGFKDFESAGKKIWNGFADFFGGIFEAIGKAVDNIISVLFPDWNNKISLWIDDVLKFFKDLKHDLIGDPIVYDIRDGIIQGFTEWITQTATDVGGWVNDRIADFVNLAKGIGENAGTAKDAVVNRFKEIKTGIVQKSNEAIKSAGKKFDELKKAANDKLKENTLLKTGKSFIKGLDNGIKSLYSIKSTINKGVNDIKSKFRNGLKPNSLTSIGKQLINGLKSGLTSALNSALSTVTSICNKITAKAKAAFAVHSPSKVFMKIGEQLVEGLIVGVDDDADNVEKSFESLVPSDDMLNEFYKRFMDMMSSLVRNVSIMFDEMIRSIDRKINSLSSLDSMYKLQHRLHDIDTRVPDIAQGYQLPSNADFTQNLRIEMDFSKLPDIMKQAFIDAIKETADLQTEDETIIVNIDGKNIFQAVRSENTKYKKQHGVSAFA